MSSLTSAERAVLITADVSYALIGIWIAWFIYKLPPSYANDPIRKHRKAFYLGALGLCIARTIWCTLISSGVAGVAPLLFNRLAFSLYLTCFSAVLFTWIHFLNMDYHVYFVKNEKFLNFVKLFLIFFNILLYLGAIVSCLIYYYHGSGYSRKEMIFFAISTFFIGLMLLVSGIKVYCMTRGAAAVRTGQLLLFIATLFGLMLLRVIMMLYHQTTGRYLNNIVYNMLSYFVPELVSVFVKMLVFSTAPEPKETAAPLAVADLENELETQRHVALHPHQSRQSTGHMHDTTMQGLNYQYMYVGDDIGHADDLEARQLSFLQIDPMSGAAGVMVMPQGNDGLVHMDGSFVGGLDTSDAPHLLALESQYQQQFTPLTAAAAAAAAAAAGYIPPTILGVSYANLPAAGYEYSSPNAAAAAAAAVNRNALMKDPSMTMSIGLPESDQSVNQSQR